jgi:hypothetical protein
MYVSIIQIIGNYSGVTFGGFKVINPEPTNVAYMWCV